MKKIGFTGTRKGMTPLQEDWLWGYFRGLGVDPFEFHHGQCVGADEQSHKLASELTNSRIILHPPDQTFALAKDCVGEESRDPQPFLVRNRDIVDECEVLIAMPAEAEEQQKGGTWYTVRYARKTGKTVYVIAPDGRKL